MRTPMRRACLALLLALALPPALAGCARREGEPAVTAQVGGEGGVPTPVAVAVAGAVGVGIGLGVVLVAVVTAIGTATLMSSGG